MKIYKYIFCKFYLYMLSSPNKINAIEGAVAILSSVILLYSATLLLICKPIILYYGVSKNVMYFSYLLFSIFIYWINLNYFKKNLNTIIKMFGEEKRVQKIIGKIVVLVLVIGSIGSVILVGILSKNIN